MTTEYYQIPSQQGLLPLQDSVSADPWLAAATSVLSLSDWSVGKNKKNPPSLFEPDDAEASVSWKHVVPLQYAKNTVSEVKSPVTPKKFNTTSSKIDAWTVVDSSPATDKQPQQPKTKQSKQTKAQKQNRKGVEEKPIEDELTGQNRYKTELCKSFNETGSCRYGTKCQFAHGREEVRPILRHPKYKTEICKTFHTTGTCPYGTRCRFIHTRSKEEAMAIAAAAAILMEEEEDDDVDDDEITAMNPPPGIPVPQWSKSWMPMAQMQMSGYVGAPEPSF